MQVITIGLDLAKHWFQVHGVDAKGLRRRSPGLWRSGVIRLFPLARTVPGRHGSLRDSAPLGT